MIEQSHHRQMEDSPLREFSGTYGGFYLLPGEAWGVSVAADGTPHARCCSCSWEYDVGTEEEAVRLVTSHLRVAHPDEPGVVDPAQRTDERRADPAQQPAR
ncbi:hypothetical protein QNO00_07360 [Arthrobacter sp. zg-Y1219]|uniref:hypothetical protein n=1 Tax=Arthrobacter sp. zg-Y1219 TaxID=3049067 RepID=UPI0024C3C685|nr:hypothetical protein [Arthrobacter sp. zg-Y1219]MDK1360084.1 hypothetical protein [Arthrobacter sp. zg-Y1219]